MPGKQQPGTRPAATFFRQPAQARTPASHVLAGVLPSSACSVTGEKTITSRASRILPQGPVVTRIEGVVAVARHVLRQFRKRADSRGGPLRRLIASYLQVRQGSKRGRVDGRAGAC